MTTLRYQPVENVFLCLSGGRLIFLDLYRNKYFCLNAYNSEVAIRFLPSLADRGDSSPGIDSIVDNRDVQRVAKALTQGGLLTQGDVTRSEPTPLLIQTVERALAREPAELEPALHISHLMAFFHASLKASWKLRCYSMLRTVRSVAVQKDRHIESRTVNHRTLGDLVTIFHWLRPFYPRKYLCLYDSLALVQFLAAYRFFPQWVFGVKAEPFGAHCWVQEGDCVLNDAAEFVRDYTPIMAV